VSGHCDRADRLLVLGQCSNSLAVGMASFLDDGASKEILVFLDRKTCNIYGQFVDISC
jgi:hypothetical protein